MKIFPFARNKERHLRRPKRRLLLENLEERILWDATMDASAEEAEGAVEQDVEVVDTAGAVDAVGESSPEVDETASGEEDGEDGEAGQADAADGGENPAEGALADDGLAEPVNPADEQAAASPQQAVTDLVVIDSSISDHETLLNDIQASSTGTTGIVVLNPGQGGFEDVAAILEGYSDLEALHVVSHGSEGRIHLDGDVLDRDNLADHADTLARWGSALAEGGDVLFYGCDVTASDEGRAFADELSEALGADAAFSDDATGAAALGADWELEYRVGDVTASAVSAPSFSGVLDPPEPTAIISLPAEALIEESVTLTVSFDNTATPGDPAATGFGPFVDIYVPVGLNVQSGPDLAGANVFELTWDATNNRWDDGSGLLIDPLVDKHPFDQTSAPTQALTIASGVNDGDKWYLVELPFGSFTSAQPITDINFQVELDEAPGAANGGAVVGNPLTVTALAGFRFGDDAINNPNVDPPIQQAAAASADITPLLLNIEKTSNAPEGETATGPNFPVEYTITVDIAPDQLVSGFSVTDLLPDSAQYRDDLVVTLNGVDITAAVVGAAGFDAPLAFQPNLAPDNDFVLPLGNVVGDAADGAVELVITYTAFYGEVDANGNPVLPDLGQDAQATNEAEASGEYAHPELGTVAVSDSAEHIHDLESLTVRKSAAITTDITGNGLSPGDTITYTLTFEVSDYHGFDDLVLVDVLGDGQVFDLGFDPVLTLVQNGATTVTGWSNATLAGGIGTASGGGGTGTSFSVVRDDITSGSTNITFLLSDLLGAQTLGDLFAGDAGTDENSFQGDRPAAGTRGTIVFQAIVESSYLDPSNNLTSSNVDLGDSVTNNATISGSLLLETGAGGVFDDSGEDAGDDTGTVLTIAGITVTKEVAYVNGVAYSGQNVSPGDVVTYRLQGTLPEADVENLQIVDFLPLPLFGVNDFVLAMQNSPGDVVNPAVDLLAGGMLYYGPAHSLQNAAPFSTDPHDPTISVDPNSNSLLFDFGTFSSEYQQPVVIDLLLTVEVLDEPFADALFLANQTVWSYQNSVNNSFAANDAVLLQVAAPEINNIYKGVIAIQPGNPGTFVPAPPENLADLEVNAPGSANSLTFVGDGNVSAAEYLANPMDSDLEGVDGGDVVTFAIAVANTGASSAWGIRINDEIPDGFVAPGTVGDLNLQIWRGDGTKIADLPANYTATLDVNGDLEIRFNTVDLDGDRLGDLPDGTVGDDLFIITYDLEVSNNANFGAVETNTAALTFYVGEFEDRATEEANFIDPADAPSDDASVGIVEPSVSKELVSTSIVNATNANNEVVIGEEVRYRVTITVPEATSASLVLVDRLDAGLVLKEITSVTRSNDADLFIQRYGDLSAGVIDEPGDSAYVTYTVNTSGRDTLSIDFGNVYNNNTDNSVAETITVEYTAIVLNVAGNQSGTLLNNEARVDWDLDGSTEQSDTDSAADVRVIEPILELDKRVSLFDPTTTATPPGDNVVADAGDVVYYSLTLRHDDISETDAYTVFLQDQLPPDFDYVIDPPEILDDPDGVTDSDGLLTKADFTLTPAGLLTFNPVGANINADGTIDMHVDREITIVIRAVLNNAVVIGDTVVNEGTLQWSSLDGTTASNGDLSNFIAEGDRERDGSGLVSPPGAPVDDYHDTDDATISIGENTMDKILVNTEISDEADATTAGAHQLPDDGDGENRAREAVIGELVTYELVATFGEGITLDARIVDQLDPGLAVVSIDSITVTGGIDVVNGVALAGLFPLGDPSLSPLVNYTHNPGNAGSDQLEIVLGNVTNIPTGTPADLTPDQVIIRYTAMVTDIPANDGNGAGTAGTQLDNGARLLWNSGTPQQSELAVADSVEVIEPVLDVSKGVSIDGPGNAPGDAGDTVTYTITVEHAADSEADAFELMLSDLFDSRLENLSLVSAAITDESNNVTVVPLSDFDLSGNQLTTTGVLNLALGSSFTLVVSGELVDAVNPADTIGNTVDLAWSSLDNSLNGDNPRQDHSDFVGGGASGEDSERDYADSASSENIVVPGPALTKTLTDSDVTDADNTLTDAAIGEILTYEVRMTLPEGTVNDAVLTDLLGAGMEYVVGSAVVSTSPSSSISYTLAPGDITTSGAVATGQTISFDFGTIVVAGDNGPDSSLPAQGDDVLIITYQVVVVDIAANSAGDSLDNGARLAYTNDAGSQQTAVTQADTVTVVEPALEVVKIVNGLADPGELTGVDAGDTVTYSITIRHTDDSSAAAYDVTLEDVLPAEIDFSAVSFFLGQDVTVTDNGAAPLTTFDFAIVGGVLQIARSGNPADSTVDMQLGREITIELTGVLQDDGSVVAGERIVNQAVVDWTSLPSGHANDGEANERGDPSDPDSVYQDSDDAVIETAVPDFDKRLTDPTQTTITIGEIVSYDLLVTVPEGVTQGVSILEQVPAGMGFIDAAIVTAAADSVHLSADFAGTATLSPTDITTTGLNGAQVQMEIGDVTALADNDASNNQFVLRVRLLVLDVPSNTGVSGVETVLQNTAEMTWSDPDDGTVTEADDPSTSTSVQVNEPLLQVSKAVEVPVAGDVLGDAGDAASYVITVTHTGDSTADAFDVVINDPIPEQFTATGVTAQIGVTDVSGAFTITADADNGQLVTIGTVNLALGESLVIRVSGNLSTDGSIIVGQSYTNTADIAWSSVSGDGEDSPYINDGSDTERGDANDHANDVYVDEASATFNTPDSAVAVQFDKLLANPGDTDVTIGETVSYDLVVHLSEGVTQGISLADQVPAGMSFLSASVITDAASSFWLSQDFNGTVPVPTVVSSGANGADIAIDIGDVETFGDGVDGNNAFAVRVTLLVLDVPTNSGVDGAQTLLTNTASLTWQHPVDGAVVVNDNTVDTPTTVTVEEPLLEVVKTVDINGNNYGFAGDAATYTVEVQHLAASTADARDVSVNDSLPAEFIPSGFTATLTGVGDVSASFQLSGQVFSTLAPIDVALGQTLTIVFSGTVSNALTPGSYVDNEADIAWSTVDGTAEDLSPSIDDDTDSERDYTATDNADFSIPGFDKEVVDTSMPETTSAEHDPTQPDLSIGEIVTYRLTATLPNDATLPVVLSDIMPDGFAVIEGTVISIGSDISGSSLTVGQQITISDPTIALFDFGTVVVADNDIADEDANRIVVEIRAQVLNDAANANGNEKTNNASLTLDDPVTLTDSATVDIVEPDLAVEKHFYDLFDAEEVETADAGNVITVRLTVSNPGNAVLHDVVIEDALDPTFFDTGTVVAVPGLPNGFVFSQAGDTVTFSNGTLNPGDSVVLAFRVVVAQSVVPNQVVTNTVTGRGDSLPDGHEGDDDPDVDREYTDEGEDVLRVPDLGIRKAFSASNNPDTPDEPGDDTPDLNIGEIATYQFAIRVPQGNPASLEFVDQLPEGMEYVDGSARLILDNVALGIDSAFAEEIEFLGYINDTGGNPLANGAIIPLVDVDGASGDGNDITIRFGEVFSVGNDQFNREFMIELQVVVVDVPSNRSGTELTNLSTIDVPGDGVDPAVSNPETVEVVDPVLEVGKRFYDQSGTQEVEVVPGGTRVMVVLELRNTGDGPAYDLKVSDPLDASRFDISSILPVSAEPGYTMSVDGNVVSYEGPGALMPGDVATFRYTVVAVSGFRFVENTVTVTAGDTVPGESDHERPKDGGMDSDILREFVRPSPAPPAPPAGPGDGGDGGDNGLNGFFPGLGGNADGIDDEEEDILALLRERIRAYMPDVHIDFVVSGAAQSGANITISVFNADGVLVGVGSTVVDAGGNWLVQFPSLTDTSTPYRLEVRVDPMSNDVVRDAEFNTRTYFSSIVNGAEFASERPSAADVFADKAKEVVESQHDGNLHPLGDGSSWERPYQYLATSQTEKL